MVSVKTDRYGLLKYTDILSVLGIFRFFGSQYSKQQLTKIKGRHFVGLKIDKGGQFDCAKGNKDGQNVCVNYWVFKMKIARVFPRKTNATPDDILSFFGNPPRDPPEVDQVHISVTFSEDEKLIDGLYAAWQSIAPVKIGGPAVGDPGHDFEPGKYLKDGYVITSRGCPNTCWFCDVPKREGPIRELPIKEGHNVLDSNILACSDDHIKAVFEMLSRQKERVSFTGGLEAKILKDWHVKLLWDLRPTGMFFAYDTTDDLEPLIEAGKKLRYADFTRRHLYCYVLIGDKKDSFVDAERRLIETWTAGFMPMAMLWKNRKGEVREDWKKFQRDWFRAAIIRPRMRDEFYK